LAKVGIRERKKREIGPKTVDVVFIGYALDTNANRSLLVNSEINEISNNTILEARDAIFFKGIFPSKTRVSSFIPSFSLIYSSPHSSSEPSIVIEPRRSKR